MKLSINIKWKGISYQAGDTVPDTIPSGLHKYQTDGKKSSSKKGSSKTKGEKDS